MAASRYELLSSFLVGMHGASSASQHARASSDDGREGETESQGSEREHEGFVALKDAESDEKKEEQGTGRPDSEESSLQDDISKMAAAFGKKLNLGKGTSVLGDDLSLDSVAKAIRSGNCKRIVVLSGAGKLLPLTLLLARTARLLRVTCKQRKQERAPECEGD